MIFMFYLFSVAGQLNYSVVHIKSTEKWGYHSIDFKLNSTVHLLWVTYSFNNINNISNMNDVYRLLCQECICTYLSTYKHIFIKISISKLDILQVTKYWTNLIFLQMIWLILMRHFLAGEISEPNNISLPFGTLHRSARHAKRKPYALLFGYWIDIYGNNSLIRKKEESSCSVV